MSKELMDKMKGKEKVHEMWKKGCPPGEIIATFSGLVGMQQRSTCSWN